MKKLTILPIVMLCLWILGACQSNDSADQSSGLESSVTTASIQGNAVNRPIEGAEVRLISFNDDGSEREIVAENKPVLTSASGGFEFRIDPAVIERHRYTADSEKLRRHHGRRPCTGVGKHHFSDPKRSINRGAGRQPSICLQPVPWRQKFSGIKP